MADEEYLWSDFNELPQAASPSDEMSFDTSSMAEELMGIRKKKDSLRDLLDSKKQSGGMDEDLAAAIVGALPMLIGYGLAGRTGGAAGAAGGLAGLDILDKDKKEKRAENKLLYMEQEKNLDDQEKDIRQQMRDASKSNLDYKRQKGLQEDRQTFEEGLFNKKLAAKGAGGGGEKTAIRFNQETKSIEKSFKDVIGRAREQADGIAAVAALLSNGSAVTASGLRTQLARASGETGALATKDVERTLGSTLWGDVVGAKNYVTGGAEDPLTDNQKKAVINYLVEKQAGLENRILKGQNEVRARGKDLAPTLEKEGRLDDVLESLGTSVTQGTQIPSGLLEFAGIKKASSLERPSEGIDTGGPKPTPEALKKTADNNDQALAPFMKKVITYADNGVTKSATLQEIYDRTPPEKRELLLERLTSSGKL